MQAWIFDVDGVLSNLEAREITQSSLFSFLAKIINEQDLIAFNTGRDTQWVKHHILDHLKQYVDTEKLLHHTFLACEKGGTWQEADKPPKWNTHFLLPPAFVDKVHLLINQEFQDCMIFDEAKKTMISIEMKQGISLDYFAQRQKRLREILAMYLQMAGMSSAYTIQEDVIATDIIHKDAGKDIGMQHILTWIQTFGHDVSEYYCFGDNPSDLHMGELLQTHALPFTFIYVGTKPLENPPFVPIITKEKFDKGTAEYLKEHLSEH